MAVLDVADPRETDKQLKELFPQKKIIFEALNVKDQVDVSTVFNKVFADFGAVDVVINGAGVLNERNIENTIGVNILGVIYGTQAALEHMSVEKGGKGGIIANIASVLGLDTLFSIPVYTATKHAVTGYTAALADKRLEKKFGVKFVTICPGFTDTPMISHLGPMLMSDELNDSTAKMINENGHQP